MESETNVTKVKLFDRVGGRKFVLTLIVIAVGTAIEMCTERGVSTGFVGLLVGVLTVFSAGNVAVTRKALGQAPLPLAPTETQALDISPLLDKQQEQEARLQSMGTALENISKVVSALIKSK